MFSIWQLSVVFFLNLVAIRVFAYCATRLGILIDSPNDRSAHRHPTVRGAGVIFVISALLFWTFIGNRSNSGFLPGLILGGSVIAAISFIDDVRSLSAGIRLAVHAIAALIFISSIPLPLFYGVDPRIIALLWWPMATVFLVGVSNIYNFMDGIDGMSSLHSILVLLGWITLFGVPHRADVLVSLGLLVPLIAFLTLNWFPAKVFMGDVGSIFIGYSIGCLALLQAPNFSSLSNFSVWILLMMPFLFDATWTLLTRVLRGEKWYRAHCSHIFQRLVKRGYSHRFVASLYGALTIWSGFFIWLSQSYQLSEVGIVVGLVIPYPLLFFWVERGERTIQGDIKFAATVPLGRVPKIAPKSSWSVHQN